MNDNFPSNLNVTGVLQNFILGNPHLAHHYLTFVNQIFNPNNTNTQNPHAINTVNENPINIQPNNTNTRKKKSVNQLYSNIPPNQLYCNVQNNNLMNNGYHNVCNNNSNQNFNSLLSNNIDNSTNQDIQNASNQNVRNSAYTNYPIPQNYNQYFPTQNTYRKNQSTEYQHNFVFNQNSLGGKDNPILIDDDDDDNDDDVVILQQKPKQQPKPLPPPLPTRIISIGKFEVEISIFPEDFMTAIDKALEISPTINLSRVSSFLFQAVQMEKVDNLVKRIIMAGNDIYTEANPSFRNDLEKIVSNFYPRLYIQDIRKILSKNSFDLTKTLDDVLKHKNLRLSRSRCVTQQRIRIVDIVASMQVIKYSTYFNQQLDKMNKEQMFKIAQRNHQLVECECCCEEVLFEDMAQCSDGHLFCRKCLNHDIQQLLGEGRTEVRCLSLSGCEQIVPDSELERCVENKILKTFFIIESQNAVQKADLPGLVKCHQCGFEATIDDSQAFHCPECGEDTCPGCGLRAHPGFSCDAMKKIDPEHRAEERMSDAVIRTCPKCHAPFLKAEGCMKMNCPRCGTCICYWCGKEIPKEIGYDHFWRQRGQCPPDKCPLWVQNEDKLQEAEMEEAQNHD